MGRIERTGAAYRRLVARWYYGGRGRRHAEGPTPQWLFRPLPEITHKMDTRGDLRYNYSEKGNSRRFCDATWGEEGLETREQVGRLRERATAADKWLPDLEGRGWNHDRDGAGGDGVSAVSRGTG